MDILELHAEHNELLRVNLILSLAATKAIVRAHLDLKMLADALRQYFGDINASNLLHAVLEGLEGCKTEQVVLRNFAFKILVCHSCVSVNERGVARE